MAGEVSPNQLSLMSEAMDQVGLPLTNRGLASTGFLYPFTLAIPHDWLASLLFTI